jgi:hypothetical protein
MKTRVDINVHEISKGITEATDSLCKKLAGEVAADARKTAQFIDKTGNLRKSIKMRKGKYSGYLAKATAPHAHLIEYGHRNKDGSITPPRPFMRTARDKVLTEANIKKAAEKVFKKEGY